MDDADPNLLFGALAVRQALIDHHQFAEACSRWADDRRRPLADFMEGSGWIKPDDRRRLEQLVRSEIAAQGSGQPAPLVAPATAPIVDATHREDKSDPNSSFVTVAPSSTAGARGDAGQRRLGDRKYNLTRLLAQGGLGTVWLARDTTLNREVALKQMREGVSAHPDMWRRFLREAQLTGQLEHPNIVPVYELGYRPDDGQPFYTMRFVRGRTLQEAISDAHKSQSAGNADPVVRLKLLQAFGSICQAIGHAHSRGVIHRDLKPANVVLGDFGEVVVLDWGLAKKIDDPAEDDDPAENHRPVSFTDAAQSDATVAGRPLGTPAYMAPEQAEGRLDLIDERTDVYGLGTILFEILTGRSPHKGTTTDQLLARIAGGETPRSRTFAPGVPRPLDAICARAMARDRSARYGSATGLAEEVDRFLADEPVKAWREPVWVKAWRWVNRHRLAVTVAVALAVTCGLLWVALNLSREVELKAKLVQAANEKLEVEASATDYNQLMMKVRDRDESRPGWTTGALDNLRKAAAIKTNLRDVMDLRGEAVKALAAVDLRWKSTVAEKLFADCLAFSPDGSKLAVAESKASGLAGWLSCSVYLIDLAAGGTFKDLKFSTLPVTRGPGLFANRVQDGVRSVGFSPDGRWLLAGTRSGKLLRWDLSRDTPTPETWQGHGSDVEQVVFTPDGRFALSRTNELEVKRWDVAGDWKESATVPRGRGVAVSASASRIFLSQDEGIGVFDLMTLAPVGSIALPGCSRLMCTDDGRFLAAERNRTVAVLDAASHRVVATIGSSGPDPIHEGSVSSLTFSPDGSHLATTSSVGSDRRLKFWDVVSGRLIHSIEVTGQGPLFASFKPDGSLLAVTGDRETRLYEVGGREYARSPAVTADPVLAMTLVPDRRAVAAVTQSDPSPDGSVTREVGLWSLGESRRLAGRTTAFLAKDSRASSYLTYLPAGPALAYSARSDREFELWGMNGPEAKSVAAADPNTLAVSPDGRRLWGICQGLEVMSWELPEFKPGKAWTNAVASKLTGIGQLTALAAGNRWVVAGGRDGFVHVLGAGDGQLVKSQKPTTQRIFSIAVHPSESFAVAGALDGTLTLVPLPSGSSEAIHEHSGSVKSVAFSADGKLFVSGSTDRSIRIWEVDGASLKPLFTLRSPNGPVEAISLSPDNSTLASFSPRERAVHTWDLGRIRARLSEMGLGWGVAR